MTIAGYVFIGIMLLIEGLIDILRQKIPIWFLITFGVGTGVIYILAQRPMNEGTVIGIGIGVLLLLFSKMTEEAIGYGDAWTFTILGVYLGGRDNMLVLFSSVFTSALFSIVLLCIGKVRKKSRFPFIPFVFMGYMVLCFSLCMNWGGL